MITKPKIAILIFISLFSAAMIALPTISYADEEEKDKCITYNSSENLISITCRHTSFVDISSSNQLQDAGILIQQQKQKQKQQQPSLSTTMNNNEEKIWLLNAGLIVEKDASLNIDSEDVRWLKIVPSENTPNAIEVDGSLKVDSVKITSWDPETDDYVKFPKDAKYVDEVSAEQIYASILRPYIKVNTDATGPTIIQNSEIAYLGYDCSGCGGITFNGGKYSILQNNDIHHIYKGFYAKGMGYMLIEGNRVYGNDKYGIDPHTGTHDMIIKDNIVYNNGHIGIICSVDCYNIIIEGNEVYNHPSTGIMFSRNMYDSIARNNYVHDEKNAFLCQIHTIMKFIIIRYQIVTQEY